MIRIPFFGDSSNDAPNGQPDQPAAAPTANAHPLNTLTDSIFSAATSGERAAKVRA